MRVVEAPHQLIRFSGGSFVPTMGALHEGHAALIRRAAATLGPTVVSIFVNPTQFGPNEDFQRYPRTLEQDLAIAEAAGADAVFAPPVEVIYPPQWAIEVPELPRPATHPGLEDACRPGHFAGVCQVVSRLFDVVNPHVAVFGEKDWQQLQVVTAMVAQEGVRWAPLRIVPGPTVRDVDGLALSSRNRYLAGGERDQALGLSRALRAASTEPTPAAAEQTMLRVLAEHHLATEYAVVREASTLEPLKEPQPSEASRPPARALIAARLGSVRLIDNAAWPAQG